MNFYEGLTDVQKFVYNKYKGNDEGFAYSLNNKLRSKDSDSYLQECKILDGIARRYQSEKNIVLHRATIESLVIPFVENSIYSNPDFLSTSTDLDSVQRHFTTSEKPVYLQIICPAGTYMIPMEANDEFSGMENEFLLPRNLSFKVLEVQEATEKKEIERIMGKFYAIGVISLKILTIEAIPTSSTGDQLLQSHSF
jgi:hypothetical protein